MDEKEKLAELEERIRTLEEKQPKDQVALVVFSGELDRAMAAFIIATGAAALGQNVSIFFTFWGLNILRKKKSYEQKDWINKFMTLLSPEGPSQLPLSKMHFFGVGSKILQKKMEEKNISSLEDLILLAEEMGVHLIACEMTRDLLHIEEEELRPNVESGGVASFLAEALQSRLALFI